jgi:hypothetical protein
METVSDTIGQSKFTVWDNEKTPLRIWPSRLKTLNWHGMKTQDVFQFIKDNPDRFEPYVYDILTVKSDQELQEQYPESWTILHKEMTAGRLRGRTPFDCAQDILGDAVFTEILEQSIMKYATTFRISKNSDDDKVGFHKATLECDFYVNGDMPLEMKSLHTKYWNFTTNQIEVPAKNANSIFKKYDEKGYKYNYLFFDTFSANICIVKWDEKTYNDDGSVVIKNPRIIPYSSRFNKTMDKMGKAIADEIKTKLIDNK